MLLEVEKKNQKLYKCIAKNKWTLNYNVKQFVYLLLGYFKEANTTWKELPVVYLHLPWWAAYEIHGLHESVLWPNTARSSTVDMLH